MVALSGVVVLGSCRAVKDGTGVERAEYGHEMSSPLEGFWKKTWIRKKGDSHKLPTVRALQVLRGQAHGVAFRVVCRYQRCGRGFRRAILPF